MSLGVVVKGPEGIVLAADSRVTLEARTPEGVVLPVHFDNATKLLSFGDPHTYVGAVTYGAAVVGLRTAHSFIPEFEVWLKHRSTDKRIRVEQFALELSNFFLERWRDLIPSDYSGPSMTFVVGGYDEDAAYGSVFLFQIPSQPEPEPRNPGDKNFGITWGGQLEIASRIIHGFDPVVPDLIRAQLNLTDDQKTTLAEALRQQTEFRIPYEILPLQDCVDLATFLVRTTMTALGLAVGVRGVGGPIEVATITRTEGLKYVQRKVIRGEAG